MTFGPVLTVTEEDRHWWFASRTRALLNLLDEAVTSSRSRVLAGAGDHTWRVLDIGSGAGNMTHHLARYGEVIGVDSFFRPLRVAQKRGYAVGQAAAESVPFADAAFDLVALLDVVEHCQDDTRVVAEARRALRPQGVLAVTVPAFPFLWSGNDTLNGHVRRYTPAGLRSLLESAGFAVSRITCNNAVIAPLAAGLNLLRSARRSELKLAVPAADADAYQVEMQPASPLVNTVLGTVGSVEGSLLRHISLPVGTGLIAIAVPSQAVHLHQVTRAGLRRDHVTTV